MSVLMASVSNKTLWPLIAFGLGATLHQIYRVTINTFSAEIFLLWMSLPYEKHMIRESERQRRDDALITG